MPDSSLLTTKLHIPRPRRELVPRPRLTERLNKGLQRKLTVISAPPGFGKTTLLAEWIFREKDDGGGRNNNRNEADLTSSSISAALIDPASVAWVSLDEQDSDPIRFWSYIIAALEKIQTDVGSNAMTLLHAPQSPPIETTLTALINAAASVSDHFVLVLDDYHLIEARSIHDALSFLIDHLPAQMHVIVISRADPPLPLTRLRVRNQLVELGESDLRFTPGEAATFLNQVMGLELAADDITALEARTEGWIAGLQLAALSMQGHRDVQSFVRAFTGSHRYIIDYLAEEVLSQQPDHVQTFLLQTSMLERLCGPLCDAIVGNEQIGKRANGTLTDAATFADSQFANSQFFLEYLDQTNLFIIPLDDERRWYRYHHLFADFLREHLRNEVGDDGVIKLHRRASHWYADNGFHAEAVNHALAAGDPQEATQLVEQIALTTLIQGEAVTLHSWLERLPEALVQPRPRLMLAWAWAKIIINEWEAVESLLRVAEHHLSKEGAGSIKEGLSAQTDEEIRGLWGEVAAIRAMMIGARDGDVARAIELSHQALEHLPETNLIIHSVIKMNLGVAYETAGDLTKASQTLQEAISLAHKADNLITVLSATNNLAMLERERGQLRRAADLYREAIQLVERQAESRGHPEHPLPIGGWAYLGLAEILREQNNLETARQYITKGLELGQQANMMGTRQIGHIILGRILQAEGDAAGALETIKAAERTVNRQSPLVPWIGAVQARLWLAQGNIASAVEWAKSCGLPLDDGFSYPHLPGEYTTLVRVLMAQGRIDAAWELLERMRSVVETTERQGRLLEVLLLQALALHFQGKSEQALSPLTQALAMARPEGYVRLFVDEGTPMAALLCQAAAQGLMSHYVNRLLNAFPDDEREMMNDDLQMTSTQQSSFGLPSLVEPLSDRELEVLQLVATGLSNQDIADKLVIAVSTVKSHTNRIYGKLDVQNRTEAVAKARALRLL